MLKVSIKVEWAQERWADGSTMRTIRVESSRDVGDLYDRIRKLLIRELALVEGEDALDFTGDQIYLDLHDGDAKITLHHEHYTSESLWAGDTLGSNELLDRVFSLLEFVDKI